MEVNIRYKEINKKAIVDEVLEAYRCGYNTPTKELIAETIDRIYKENSKHIESVTVLHRIKSGYEFLKEMKLKDNILTINYEDFDKAELSQLIDILTTIKNQM